MEWLECGHVVLGRLEFANGSPASGCDFMDYLEFDDHGFIEYPVSCLVRGDDIVELYTDAAR